MTPTVCTSGPLQDNNHRVTFRVTTMLRLFRRCLSSKNVPPWEELGFVLPTGPYFSSESIVVITD